MPATIIPFPLPSGGTASAFLTVGKRRTVRFLSRPRRAAVAPPKLAPLPFSETHADQRLIDGARLTARNFRVLASKATTRANREAMEKNAAKWEARADELTATMHGRQQPAEGLFETSRKP